MRRWTAVVMAGLLMGAAAWSSRAASVDEGGSCCGDDLIALATCTGSASCRACSNCSSCGYCGKRGGTCGVCAPRTVAPATPAAPAAAPPREVPLVRRVPPPTPRTPAQAPSAPVAAAEHELSDRPALAAAFEDGIAVYFSPDGHCTAAIVEQIAQAERSVRVLAYRLTSVPIAAALRDAHRRGVKVLIVLDKTQQSEKYSDATFFHNAGVPVWIDPAHAIAHNKVMILDESIVITGSFNFSKAAEESNAENVLIIRDKPVLAEAYLGNFDQHLAHARAYLPPGSTTATATPYQE